MEIGDLDPVIFQTSFFFVEKKTKITYQRCSQTLDLAQNDLFLTRNLAKRPRCQLLGVAKPVPLRKIYFKVNLIIKDSILVWNVWRARCAGYDIKNAGNGSKPLPSLSRKWSIWCRTIPELQGSGQVVLARVWTNNGTVVRPNSAHTASHVAQVNCRTAEGVGNHDQDRPGTPLQTTSHRLGLSSHWNVEPGVPLSLTWST